MIRLYPFLFLFVKEERFRLNDTLLPDGTGVSLRKRPPEAPARWAWKKKLTQFLPDYFLKKVKQKID